MGRNNMRTASEDRRVKNFLIKSRFSEEFPHPFCRLNLAVWEILKEWFLPGTKEASASLP